MIYYDDLPLSKDILAALNDWNTLIYQLKLREIIDTFHARKISVVAEGIETEGEFETMNELGADFFQGYYLKKPS